jgi:hypothetical protein
MASISLLVGILLGALIAALLFGIALRLFARSSPPVAPQAASGLPDATFTLSREALQRLIDDALRDMSIPLVSLRDPTVQLEPGGVIVLHMRGDTVLLGAQPVVLRMWVVPTADGVGVQTERAEVGGSFNIAGGLTERLDERINADLAQRLSFAEQFEVLAVDGTTDAITVEARLRE